MFCSVYSLILTNYSFIYVIFSSDMSGSYSDSGSGSSSPNHLIPSHVLTTSAFSSEEYNNLPLQPSTIIPSVNTNFINFSQSPASVFIQTTASNFNPPFTSTTLIMKNLVTIEPSSTFITAIIESNFNSYSSETLFSPMTTFPEGLSDASTLPSYSLSTMPVMNSLVISEIEPSPHTSTATMIASSFNAYNSEGITLSTTFPEELSGTFTQPPNNLSTVTPAPSISSPNTFSTNRWRCIEGNVTGDNTREYIFPALVMEDLNFTLWQDTLQDISYLYHVNSSEIGCSGTVTEIRFCYRVSLNVSTEEHIFTMSIMNSSRHVLKTVEITSTPTNSSGDSTTINCMNDHKDMKYCCDSMDLTDFGSVTFPKSEFILGIETSNSSQVRLQNYRSNLLQGMYNLPMLNISEVNKSVEVIANTLPVIRYLLCKSKTLNCLFLLWLGMDGK